MPKTVIHTVNPAFKNTTKIVLCSSGISHIKNGLIKVQKYFWNNASVANFNTHTDKHACTFLRSCLSRQRVRTEMHKQISMKEYLKLSNASHLAMLGCSQKYSTWFIQSSFKGWCTYSSSAFSAQLWIWHVYLKPGVTARKDLIFIPQKYMLKSKCFSKKPSYCMHIFCNFHIIFSKLPGQGIGHYLPHSALLSTGLLYWGQLKPSVEARSSKSPLPLMSSGMIALFEIQGPQLWQMLLWFCSAAPASTMGG